MTFATGYVPDDPGHRRTPFARLAARLSSSVPQAASLAAFLPSVLDQGPTSSCTGSATAAAIFTSLGAAGRPLAWIPSPRGIYCLGRAIDRLDPATPLADDGAMPNQVMRGISEWGIRPMHGPTSDGRNNDCEPANVNAEPTLDELETDATKLVVGEYEIVSGGSQRIADICAAIVGGFAVTVAIAGGSRVFQAYSGGVLPAMNAPLDHYVLLHAFETDASGQKVFGGRNSWGSWGEAGNFRLSEAAIDELGDLVVLNVKVVL